MSKQKTSLAESAEEWDHIDNELEYISESEETPENFAAKKKKEGRHKTWYKEIKFLDNKLFNEFELNMPRPFENILEDWLSQFNGHIPQEYLKIDERLCEEKRFAFILARKTLFINRQQIIALVERMLELISRKLYYSVCSENDWRLFGHSQEERKHLISTELDASLFVPLSDSSRFMEFRHRLPEGANVLTMSHFDLLYEPVRRGWKECIAALNASTLKNKRNLFIIEDFAGSGETAITKIQKIREAYNFERIYFCPLIISQKAVDRIKRLKDIQLIFSLLVGNEFSVSSTKEDTFWTNSEQSALTWISKKYFDAHFKVNGYLYYDSHKLEPVRPTPFGFMDGGFAIALHSNCPNNSLPILWETNDCWYPLFRRHERFKKVLEVSNEQ